MITFKTIRWKNMLSTGNAFTEVKLDRSKSTLIVGQNGAGKSTILDALCWAMYGKPFRKINKPQLLNSINGKGMLVELELNIAGADYTIIRGMKPHRFEVYKNDQLLNQDALMRDYQEYLEKNILKLNYRSFCQVVVLGSATYVPFMQLAAYQRREVIEDLLDIQIFSSMNTLLKEKISKHKDDTQTNRYNLDITNERIEMEKVLRETLSNDVEAQIEARNNSLLEAERVIAGLTELERLLTDEINDKSKQTADLKSVQEKLNRLQTAREKLSDKIDKITKEIGFYHDNENCPSCKQGIDHDFRAGIIDAKKTEIESIQKSIPDLEAMYKSLEQRFEEIIETQAAINELNNQMSGHRAKMQLNKQRIKELQAEIKKLKEDKEKHADSEKLVELNRELGTLEGQREQLIRDGIVLTAGATLLKDGGIKTKIIKQYVPIMNKLINKYLTAMDFFVHFELDEQFNESIKSRFRDEFSYQSFSEGEKMRINLAILFTWRAIAKMRNSASTNLLIMDEVFDSSLDASGTEEFMKIIEDLTKDTNLFVISHKGDQLFDKFHSVIKFEKHGNFSVMGKA
jgi:DNA repair exonuclease SbcCD ATPase subunit